MWPCVARTLSSWELRVIDSSFEAVFFLPVIFPHLIKANPGHIPEHLFLQAAPTSITGPISILWDPISS